ncbi:MAG: type IV pilin protein [Rhizobacter sp.]
MTRASQQGFTLIELMVATAVAGILASIAYPSFQGPVFKARRSDGLTALLQLQMNQERWHSEHGAYASLADLKVSSNSSMGYYELGVTEATASSFAALATGTGAQTRDSACRVLRLSTADGNTSYASGADEHASNSPADNKRCWNL